MKLKPTFSTFVVNNKISGILIKFILANFLSEIKILH